MSNNNFTPSITVFCNPKTSNWDVVLQYLTKENEQRVVRCYIPLHETRGKLNNKTISLEPNDDYSIMSVTYDRKTRHLKRFEKEGRVRFWQSLTPLNGANEVASLEQMRQLHMAAIAKHRK